ncbi:MAG: NUDIX domain-containing protein [Candidatus Kariarchaeaceae archaeon]
MTQYKVAPDTVDAILEQDGKIAMIRRKKDPFRGQLALPGGFVDYGERVEEALVREVKEELGVEADIITILGVYSGMDRDPRGPTISTVFICSFEGIPVAGDDAESFEWYNPQNRKDLAFDHNKIIEDFILWKENKSTFWSTK